MTRTFVALLLTIFLAATAAAQDTGVVSGTVVDSSGQVVPGATITLTNEATASVRTLTSDERGDFAFRALTPGSYTVTVDGLNGNELSGTGRMNSSINLDAIAEVKVLLNTYKAEFGHSAGANIEIVSKSGSQQYHGSGYWYGRRDAWNATPWENERAGLPKPKLKIDTPGFNLGGPVKIPGLGDGKNDKKLFFFYSMEAPQVQKPGQVRLYRMPTSLERRGDFSQTLDANGRLVYIKDPLSSGACNAATGGAGCFTNNVIPSSRLDPNALALLNMMPLPNVSCSTPGCGALSNFTRQETPDNPRMNNLLRIDGRPSGNNSYWFPYRQFSSNQLGSEITAGPAKWGYFNGNYVSGDSGINGGWNRVLTSN